MTRRKKPASAKAANAHVQGTAPESVPERGPGVSPDERHRLAECCAFFKAAQYRPAAPGEIRQRDIAVAEAEIDAVLRSRGRAGRRARAGK